MAIFTVGKRYQGNYTVEHNVPFFDGDLAIANYLDERYYLQSAPLVREFTTLEFNRFKRLYDELDFELLLPVSEMFQEGTQAVFVYPYQPIKPIRDIVLDTGVDDEKMLGWFHQVIQTEIALQSMGIPMYIIRDPRNIGLTNDGELRVIFSGIEDVTYYQSALNWGTFLYCIASGEYLDEPLKKLPPKHALSKPVAKVIQKCLRAKDLPAMLSVIEQSMKKQEGKGLIGSLFGLKKKKEEPTPETLQMEVVGNDHQQSPTEPKQEESSPGPTADSQPATDNFYASPSMDPQQTPKLEKDPFDWSQENSSSSQKTEPSIDPFEQQLEQMYQSMEQEQKEQQKAKQEETDFFLSQEQENSNADLDQTMIYQPNQELDLQLSTAEASNKPTDLSKDQQPVESSFDSGGFTRKPSTEMDETQIFSASDLSSLEEELKAMQEDQLQMNEQKSQKPNDSDPSQQTIPTIEAQPSVNEKDDELKQLEDLFGELEQLQQQDSPTATVIPEKGSDDQKPSSTSSTETVETVQNPTSTVSDLDSKVQELESLFDEINQLQAKEQANAEKIASPPADEQPVGKSVTNKEEKPVEEKTAPVKATEVVEETPVEKEEPAATAEKKKETEPEPVDPLEKLRLQFEKEQQALIEEQRKKFEERKQALINQAQEEMKKRQQQLLSEIEQQEEQILNQLQKDLKVQEEEQLEFERKEKERLKAEYEKRKQEEMRKLELDNLQKKHEKEVEAGLTEIKQEFAEKEKQKLEELEKEFAKKKQAVIDELAEERQEAEKAFQEKKQKEWEQIVKDYEGEEDPEDTDEGSETEKVDQAVEEKDPSKEESSDDSKETSPKESKENHEPKEQESNELEKKKSATKRKKKKKENKHQREKKRLKKRKAEEEKKKHDDLASQFDEHKQELLSGSSRDDNSTVNSE